METRSGFSITIMLSIVTIVFFICYIYNHVPVFAEGGVGGFLATEVLFVCAWVEREAMRMGNERKAQRENLGRDKNIKLKAL